MKYHYISMKRRDVPRPPLSDVGWLWAWRLKPKIWKPSKVDKTRPAKMYHKKTANMLLIKSIIFVTNMFGSQHVWLVVAYQLTNHGMVVVQNFEYHSNTINLIFKKIKILRFNLSHIFLIDRSNALAYQQQQSMLDHRWLYEKEV